jgi:MYXO-CTERM domain-containing protein
LIRTIAGALLLLALASPRAEAWQIADPIHSDCHERITKRALDAVGHAAPPPAMSEDDRRLRQDAQFDTADYDDDILTLALVIGARFPDLHGAPSFDFDNLARVHNAREDQSEHCLRAETQNGGEVADRAALADCRATIERLHWRALATLDEETRLPDPSQRTLAPIHIPHMGTVRYPLPALHFEAGRALHAIQDSFTHTYRTPDWRRVRHVLNWVDQVRCTLDEAEDGHGHETSLDDCEAGHPSNAPRMAAATEASEDFLRLLDQPGTRSERGERLAAFLDKWMSHEPGCTRANGYCADEVHAALVGSSRTDDAICDGGCAVADGPGYLPVWALLIIGGLLLLLRRRPRALALALLCLPSTAGAAPGYHTEVRASMSVQNPAYAVGLAGAWAWTRFEAGAFAELNPWYSYDAQRMSMGATNVGIFAHYLQPLGSPDVLLRAGLGGGVSVLNEEMIGSDAGTSGIFLNLRLLGLAWQFERDIALTVDGFDLALAAPQTVGWPVLVAQHRLSFGLQF